MKEITGDLWDFYNTPNHFICITTNGFVKKNGEAVMGRGCALEATRIIRGIEAQFGQYIRERGHVPGLLQVNKYGDCVIIFPVKYNWWQPADLDLIRQSSKWLCEEALSDPSNTYVLPRPGCGNGKLDWKIVKPLLEHLPDNVLVITKG